jgi:hypothetical protein
MKTVITQDGWYWARRRFGSAADGSGEATFLDWEPVWIHDPTGDGWEVHLGGPVDRWPGEIGPMLAEQGPSRPVHRVEISVPKMEAMVRDVAMDALRHLLVLPPDEPPMELLLEMWNDGYSHGSDGCYAREHVDGEPAGTAEVRRVLEKWSGR